MFKKLLLLILFCFFIINLNGLVNASPHQQEYSNFRSIENSHMVNEFTGSFSYSIPVVEIPGPHGSGYTLTLSYQSGVRPEDEASWVGLGWTLNPGAINRIVNGFPDDYYDQPVIYWNKTRPVVSATRTNNFGIEAWSIGMGVNDAMEMNNNFGFRYSSGLSLSYDKSISLSLRRDASGTLTGSFSFDLFPQNILSMYGFDEFANIYQSIQSGFRNVGSYLGLSGIENLDNIGRITTDYITNPSAFKGFNIPKWETHSSLYSGLITLKPTILQIGIDEGFGCNFSKIENKEPMKIKKVYGYMFSGDVTDDNALMDYFVENESDFQMRDKYLPCPFSNADEFIVSGEGVQGSFRLYNKNVGHFRPNKIESSKSVFDISVNLNFGSEWGAGFHIPISFGSTILSGINDSKTPISKYLFASSTDIDNPYFFRFYNDMGGSINFGKDPLSVTVFAPSSFNLPSSIPFINVNALLGLGFEDKYISPQINSSLHGRCGASSNISYRTYEDIYNDWYLNRENAESYKKRYPNDYYFQYGDWEKLLLVVTEHKEGELPNNADKKDNKINFMLPILLWNYAKHEFSDVKSIDLSKIIREFTITNKNGERYIYGQPVFSRSERTFTYNIEPDPFNNNGIIINDQHMLPNYSDEVNGFEKIAPYPSTYLLTEIFTPDYIDRLNDGPTDDDFGGYTKFNYSRTAGSGFFINKNYYKWLDVNWHKFAMQSGLIKTYPKILPKMEDNDLYLLDYNEDKNWFNWRMPYKGLKYSRNSLSDPSDDKATVTMGQKEIYYLDKIETKTHIAYFINNKSYITINLSDDTQVVLSGSGQERYDGMEAAHNEWEASAGGDYTADSLHTEQNNKLRFLEKIVLCAKDVNNPGKISKIIRTTHFKYDYSLQPNTVNSKYHETDNPNKGKLTLRKVWFEEENVKEKQISPYIFHYEYKDFEQNLPPIYAGKDIGDYGSALEQNPDYSVYQSDAWGYYQREQDGIDNFSENINSVKQKQATDSDFDPAAYHLKSIQLPTGGEIHIQYEQNEYNYVQNRKSMILAKIQEVVNDDNASLPVVKVELSDVFEEYSSLSAQQKQDYIDSLKKYFEKQRIYFRLNYKLPGDYRSSNNQKPYSTEIIKGYADVNVDGINIVDDVLMIPFASSNNINNIPFELCREFYNTQRKGYITNNLSGRSLKDEYTGAFTIKMIYELYNRGLQHIIDKQCLGIDLNSSYIRIPTPIQIAKKGGGVRVKRLIMADKLNSKKYQNFDEYSIYGKEYIYKDDKGCPSGVASNEPEALREENALTEFLLSREDFNPIQKFLGHNDLSFGEKPIGRSLLPAASVGYSRVVAKDIFEGITDPGFVISEYFTTKDYPYDAEYKVMLDENEVTIKSYNHTDIFKRNEDPLLTLPIFTWEGTYACQGYSFLLNSMNGQKKGINGYSGKFSDMETWVNTTSELYEYFKPGERIPVFYQPESGITPVNKFEIREEYPGLDMEIVCESKQIEDKTGGVNIRFDLDFLFFLIPVPLPSAFPYPYFNYTVAKTHVMNKIIKYPTVLKRVTKKQEGLITVTENVAFDRYSGDAVITRSIDGFDELVLKEKQKEGANEQDGSYYTYNFLASNQYTGMSQKAINEGMRINSDFNSSDYILAYHSNDMSIVKLELISNLNSNLYKIFDKITTGDLIKCSFSQNQVINPLQTNVSIGYFYVDRIDYGLANFKDKKNIFLKSFFPWDDDYLSSTMFDNGGTIGSSPIFDIQIIKSGRNNKLTTSAGSILTYGNSNGVIDCGVKIPEVPRKCYNWDLFEDVDIYPPIEPLRPLIVGNLNNFLKILTPPVLDNITPPPLSFRVPDSTDTNSILILSNYGPPDTLRGDRNLGYEISVIPYSDNDSVIVKLNIDRSAILPIDTTIYNDTLYSHPLADDLNDWLDRVWRADVNLLYGDARYFDSCFTDNSCDTTQSTSSQKYKSFGAHLNWGLYGEANYNDGGLNDLVDYITGLVYILNKGYYINGKVVRGADIIESNPCDTFGHFQKYFFTHKTTDTTFNTFISRSEIRFKDNLDIGWMGIRRQVQRYTPPCQLSNPLPEGYPTDSAAGECMDCDCSNYKWYANQANVYNSNWYKAWIDLPLGNSESNPGYKEFTAGSNPEENNDDMMSYMLIDDTLKFTEKFGRFEVSYDGWLVYKPLDVGLDKCYNNDEPIKIIRLNDNPLVYDLNRWLNNVWSLNLARALPHERNWMYCADDNDTTLINCESVETNPEQNFKNMGVYNIWPPLNDSTSTDFGLSDKIDSLSGLKTILNSYYFVDGEYKSGSDIIIPNPVDENGDFQKYYLAFDNNSFDSVSAYIGKSEIKFKSDTNIWMGIRRQFQRYGMRCEDADSCSNPFNCQYSDCSNYPYFCDQSGNYLSNWFKAWVDLPINDTNFNEGYREFYDYSTADSNNLNMLSYMKLNKSFTSHFGRFELDTNGWLIYKPILSVDSGGFYVNPEPKQILRLFDKSKRYDSVVTYQFVVAKSDLEDYLLDPELVNPNNPNSYGPFFLDPINNSQLAFGYNDNDIKSITYPPFYIPYTFSNYCLSNVIKAEASLYKGGIWEFTFEESFEETPGYTNPVAKGEFGIYRQNQSFIYNTDNILPGAGLLSDENDERIYKNSGVINHNVYLLGWTNPSFIIGRDNKWMKINEITKYSSGGEVAEYKNIYDIYSTSKYCYNNIIPYLTANNVEYNQVGFQSFEDFDIIPSGIPNNSDAAIVDYMAHTGKHSLQIRDKYDEEQGQQPYYPIIELKNFELNEPTDFIVKLWVKLNDYYTWEKEITSPIITPIDLRLDNGSLIEPIDVNKIAQSGDWSQYEAQFNSVNTGSNSTLSLLLRDIRTAGSVEPPAAAQQYIYIDDVRIQPVESEMTGYVYDNATLKPAAILDDQNFALIYQYDFEGNLVRQSRETQNGIKTVSEVHTNNPLAARDEEPVPIFNPGFGKVNEDMNNQQLKFSMPSRYPVREGIKSEHPGIEFKSSVLDIKASPDKVHVKVLDGMLTDSTFKMDSLIEKSKDVLKNIIPSKGKSDFDKSLLKSDNLKRNLEQAEKVLNDSNKINLNFDKYKDLDVINPDSLTNRKSIIDSLSTNTIRKIRDSIGTKGDEQLKKERNYKVRQQGGGK